MKKRNGFTLIELLAVIVILAIIALIATPMVLKYIKTAKKGSYDTSINNILRAADNYYASSLLDNNATYPLNFVFPKNKDLGIKGKQPDSGYLTLYEDGSTYLYAVYDDIVYTKLPNETKASRYDVVIGDDVTWTTDGNGKITKYNAMTDSQKIEYQLQLFLAYLYGSTYYAMRDESMDFDYNLSLKENMDKLEQEAEIDRSGLPLELNEEIDIILELYNTDKAITEEEAFKMIEDNRDKIPYYANYYDVATSEGFNGDYGQMEAYQLIKDNLESSNLLVIPNYVKHSDGTKEKITAIDTYAFRDYNISTVFDCYIAPPDANTKGLDVIISDGIEEIGENAFSFCLLNSVNIANSVKKIGASGFAVNGLKSIILPSSLEYIDEIAFGNNDISEQITIPKGVTFIGEKAFSAEQLFCDESMLNHPTMGKICKSLEGKKNRISNVTFEKESKIETIDTNAFAGNNIENITIPGSIKSIGSNAFNCPTLKSATIERAKGSDLTVDSSAFGSIVPVYKP